jgi:signal transduction histidine kinase
VLLNLLTNAVRHAPPNGAVSVVVESDTDHVVVAVEDSGNGLAPGAPQRMFERFWRDDESRARSSGGAGLGLAIAQGLVQAHGGRIRAGKRHLWSDAALRFPVRPRHHTGTTPGAQYPSNGANRHLGRNRTV